ncbi:hypothetical protein GCM10020000_61210 [Streptomyces olivoverticillatus]
MIKKVHTPHGRDVRVAILGLTNPGIAIWDKANVQGKMVFPGLEEQAAKWVPKLRSMGGGRGDRGRACGCERYVVVR